MNSVISLFLKVLMSMFQSLLTEKFMKWAILKLAELLVKSTENTKDDEWFERIKKEVK